MKLEPRLKEKQWNAQLEGRIWKQWEKEKTYEFNVKSKKKVFSIDTPPPYPSGAVWHIGAAAHYSQIDMIARTARMLSFEVLFPIGIDRNGLPVEMYTEKKFGISIHTTSREKFIEYCKTALDDLEAEMIQTMKTMGMSGDFDNYYRTDSDEYRALTQATFIQLWEKKMVLEDARLNNYCPGCKTTLSDNEIEYKEKKTMLNYINFTVKETGEKIVIATTRPELLCTAGMVIFNPKDKRHKHLEDKTAVVPLYEKEIPIKSHPMADVDFGSGLVFMSKSAGDQRAIWFLREMKIEPEMAVNIDGMMRENSVFLTGMPVEKAREKIIEMMKGKFLVKQEEIMHRTPVCERSKHTIEYIAMPEYYLKQLDFIPQMKKFSKELIFHPELHRQRLIDWINGVTMDWPVSRRRFYATEIPVWYCRDCKTPHIPPSGKYYKPWIEKAPFKKCNNCGCKEFIGEDRTFDTWFDSSISPLFISGYLKNEELFKKAYPSSLRPQSKDIIRTWLYYTLLRCYQLTGKNPFKHAWIMGYGVDEKGEKMSKSKGNVIDPIPLLEKYGADAFRFWNATEASLGSDFRCSEERIVSSSKFLTKLWNITRFISSFPEPKKAELQETDKWILSELNEAIKASLKGYEDFNFFVPANRVREFVWNVFADHYIEMVKTRAYGEGFSKEEQEAAWYTLHLVLKSILKLLAPIASFSTDFIWRELYGERSIHLEEFPKTEWNYGLEKLTQQLIEFNTQIWKTKKEKGMSLKAEIKTEVPKELKMFEKDLKSMHNMV